MSDSASLPPAGRPAALVASPASPSTENYRGPPSTDASPSVETPPSTPGEAHLGRFRVLRPHAQGGLGQVSVAFDGQLHREVALKQIRPDRLDSPAARQRFLNEAEVTGQLEHPGIVPVYALDRDEAGEPYYAMRFVQGRTLAEAIADHHRSPSLLAFHALLRRFVAVCQAVAYAHSKGILHRDLKPANVLVGDYGETLLVDWGLAKRMGSPVAAEGNFLPALAATADDPTATTAFCPPVSEGSVTQAGQVLGTPAYMSPEQAEGDLVAVSPATDVYALGAVLYQLLTGRPPYPGRSAEEVIAGVRRGPPQPPGQVRRGVPRGLEAVCLKAMARQPGQRYATAADLAAEVERWLADEPVHAYPEPWAERARRWARRHRPLVAGAAALLVTAVVALAIGIVLVSRERRHADKAREDAEDSADAARAALAAKKSQERRTRAALDTLTDDAVERLLQRQDRLGEEDRARFPGWVPYTAARAYAAAAAKVDSSLAAQYADRAVDSLGRARDAGYFKEAADVEALKNEPDFGPVRGRDDFKKLLKGLAGGKKREGGCG